MPKAVSTLQPGRELDALVAEQVMGWKWYVWKPLPWPCSPPADVLVEIRAGCRFLANPEVTDGFVIPASGDEPIRPEKYHWIPPQYSTKIEDAWLVVERMRTHGQVRRQDLEMICDFDGRTFARFGVVGEFEYSEASGEHATPWAICLAALQAYAAKGSAAVRE